MDISRLIPYIKKALDEVTPEEVYAQLQKQKQDKQEDRERETVDNEVIEQDEKPNDALDNAEGSLMESAFQELNVEDAIDQAKQEKKLVDGGLDNSTSVPGMSAKMAGFQRLYQFNKPNLWQHLKTKIR